MNYDLKLQQLDFVKLLSSGTSQTHSYREAYNPKRMSAKTVWEAASRLSKNPKVVARLEELKAEKEAEKRMLRLSYGDFVINELRSMALNSRSGRVRIKALELLGGTVGLFET